MLGVAEGQVIIRGTRDVEAIGVGEDLLVAIGGGVPDRDLRPLTSENLAQKNLYLPEPRADWANRCSGEGVCPSSA